MKLRYTIAPLLVILIISLLPKDIFCQAGQLDASFGQEGIVNTEIDNSGQAVFLSAAIQIDGKIVAGGYAFDSGDKVHSILARYNSDGSLDYTFGTNGIVIGTLTDSTSFMIRAIAIQHDGKIISGGIMLNRETAAIGFVTARFKTNGSLDSTFGENGYVFTSVGLSSGAQSTAIQSDGKIILGGFGYSGNTEEFRLIRLNSNGGLDNTFGTGGLVNTSAGAGSEITSIVIQSDGKIIAGGFGGNGYTSAVARYNTNGTLDNTFGTNGILIQSFGDPVSSFSAVAIQNGNRIIAAGYVTNKKAYDQAAIIRLNNNGVLDSTFGTDGIVVDSTLGSTSYLNSLTIQDDGKIVAAGTYNSLDGIITRLDTNGVPDSKFGNNGNVSIDISNFLVQALSVVSQNDGKLLMAGNLGDFAALYRLNNDGTFDNGFGTNGVGSITSLSSANIIKSIGVQNDQQIIAAGFTKNGKDTVFAVARYNQDGSLDNSFGSSGIDTLRVGTSKSAASSAAVQKDGKIVLAGYTFGGNDEGFALARFNSNGFIDNSLGTNSNGTVITPIGISNSSANSVVIQSDGKILAGGQSFDGTNYNFTLARYTAGGSLDNTFGKAGIATTSIGLFISNISSLALQTDGKIIAAGFSTTGATRKIFTLVRYNPNGDVDTTFGQGGIVTTSLGGSRAGNIILISSTINSVNLTNDGKIIAVGNSTTNDTSDFTLVRYNNDGSIDTTFGTHGIVITRIRGTNSVARSAVLESNGKIIATGYSNNGSNSDFTVIGYNPDGNIDSTFGTKGITMNTTGISSSFANSVAMEKTSGGDEKIITGGYSTNGIGYSVFTLARYNTSKTPTGIKIEKKDILPSSFALEQNYPNPFNPTTIISWQLPVSGHIVLKIYDILGREITTLVNGVKPAGNYTTTFDASRLSSGVYFYSLKAGNFYQVKKMILLK
jgi:uncharacterized delta-60 repeat protein